MYNMQVIIGQKTRSFPQVFLKSSMYTLEDSHHDNLSWYVHRVSHFPLTSCFGLRKDQLHLSFIPGQRGVKGKGNRQKTP